METPTGEEIVQWKQNPVTRYVAGVLKNARFGSMEQAAAMVTGDAERIALLDRATGLKIAIDALAHDVEDE